MAAGSDGVDSKLEMIGVPRISMGGSVPGRASMRSLARILGLDALTSAMGRLPVFVATAIVVTVAVTSAAVVSYLVWWLATDVMPPNVLPISITVAIIVATPIATYLVSIIHSLAQSRAEIARQSRQLLIARNEASEANRAKSQFLASTSHELRTPLNAIIGFSEILKDELFGSGGVPRYVDYARDIHESSTHLLEVINDILDLSRIESGQQQIDTQENCDLTLAIVDAIRIVGVMADKVGVRLNVQDIAMPIAFWANNRMMRQMLINILSNAVKFTPVDGTVSVRAWLDPSKDVVIEIADTGIGMTRSEIEVAMQPFGQIDSMLSRRHEGTGLGLPLAKAMAELHGGTLTIRSVPRAGTTATFVFPGRRSVETAPPMELPATSAD